MAPPAKQQVTFGTMPAAAKVFLGVMIMGLLVIIYYFAIHASLVEQHDSARAEYSQLETQLVEAQRRNQEYIELQTQVASREGLDRANRRILPTDAEQYAFVEELDRLRSMSGVEILSIQPRPEEPDDQQRFFRLPVALRLRGRYHQLLRFLHNVSRMERATSMENVLVRVIPTTTGGGETVLTLEALATTFRRPLDEAPAGGPS